MIYFFHCYDRPVYLTAIYAKTEKNDLTPAERNDLRAVAAAMNKS